MLRFATRLLFVLTSAAFAAEAPIPAAERAQMLADFTAQLVSLDRAIAERTQVVTLYSRRGDCHLFLGAFTKAVADFEKMIALDPTQDAPHWRLGIAYHFTGQFEKSAQQFEKYHAYDGGDRENGIWKFFGDAKVDGLELARRTMLEYTRFDREPFPALYEMFAGEKTTDALFAELKARKIDNDPKVMFFANYYGGLNEEVLGRRERALALLRKAVASPWRLAEGGPTYMWQVARLHYEMLAAAKP
jgi:lipoprotein NlpI